MKYLLIIFLSLPLVAIEYSPLAINSIFYQPLLKDKTKIDLEKSFKTLHKFGIKQVILQWTKHGVVDFTKETSYINNILSYGEKYHIKIIFGLYADPDYFYMIGDKKLDLKIYLKSLKKENIAQALRVHNIVKTHNSFDGWYIYDELDDVHFKEKSRQTILKDYLQVLANSLNKIAKKHIYISGFYTKKMTPKEFSQMFSYILQDKYTFMLQSGVGAKLLTQNEYKQFLNKFSKNYKKNFIPIVEAFHTNYTSFKVQIATVKSILKNPKVNLFSLRYFITDSFLKNYKNNHKIKR